MQKIVTCLWFDNQAEEAARFYTSIFKNSKIENLAPYSEAGRGEAGSVMTVNFELEGAPFIALNGGPHFSFTPAISLFVHCETQEEVDWYWEKLGEGGAEDQCGWLRDRYGLSWQIVPNELMRLMSDPDPEKVARVTQAMLGMVKLEVGELRKAYDGG